MIIRKGLGRGKGKGYYNLPQTFAFDRKRHQLAGKGIKSPQKIPILFKKGDIVKSKFTKAEGTVVSTDPFTVKYQYNNRNYVRLSNPNFWIKGGKIPTHFRNFIVYRVSKLPPNAKIRIHDIGRKGHSLRMAFYHKGKWRTYQFLINKSDINTISAKKLIAQIKKVYPSVKRGGKDMPVKDISEIMTEIPKKMQIEDKSTFGQKIFEGIKNVGKGIKKTEEFLKETAKKYKESRQLAKQKEIATVRPEIKKLVAQHNRVETLKSHIDLQEKKGMDVSNEIEELEEEMKQLRELQEKTANINLENLSNNELRILAIRHKDDRDFISDFLDIGSKNEYRDELLRRIRSERQLNKDIKIAQTEPLD